MMMGALSLCACSDDAALMDGNSGANTTQTATVSKITSVFTNGTNMSVGSKTTGTSRATSTLTVGESETVCAKYDVAAGFQSEGTVPYIKVSVHVYEDCSGECDKLRLTFKDTDGLECKADDFAIRATDGTYLAGTYGMDEEGNQISEYNYGNLSISGDMDIIIGGLNNLDKTHKKGGEEENVINTFEVWIWPQNTKNHTWTKEELDKLAQNHEALTCVKEETEDPHEGVDMGDIVWSTENMEGYYAWGEIFTAPTIDGPGDTEETAFTYGGTTYTNNAAYYPFAAQGGKKYYNYNHYRYFDGTSRLTKYQWNDDNTSLDGKTTLDPTDDVATMRWGNGWRMPTKDEMDELINGKNTVATTGTTTVKLYNAETGEYYDKENVKALIVTSKITNNTIVLPSMGYYGSNSETDEKTKTKITDFNYSPYFLYYWTSTLSTQIQYSSDNKSKRYGGFIYGTGVNRQWCNESLAWMALDYGDFNGYDRSFGMKVRPVKDK